MGTTGLISSDGLLETVSERKHVHHHHLHHVTRRGGGVKGLLKKPIEFIVVELGLRKKKKLGHWMFLMFRGVFLFLGVLKIGMKGWGSDGLRMIEEGWVYDGGSGGGGDKGMVGLP
ncbi:hypothetical protein PIB30_009413 [Stylosanthes scabra]|uniref:Transmembrane protein n=1 Tax=Stylosanthes scabra TaxID=79078 RepID=A0ABU6W375_9FABA|nr:hypothetical protein [Stylosanthes scabra]